MSSELAGKSVAVLVEQMFEDLELWYPVLRLRAAGADVKLLGNSVDVTYVGRSGYSAKADALITDVSPDEFDAVIVPGGYAPDLMRRHRAMVGFVHDMDQQEKVVGAICHAGWMLAESDILRGRTATCFFSIRRDVENAGATFIDAEVVRDANLVTSRNVSDLPAFVEAVIATIVDQSVADRQKTAPVVTGSAI